MKRSLIMFALALFLSSAELAFGQNDPFVGTWSLNTAESKYNPGPAPRSQTRTWEPSGDGQKVVVDGIDATGKRRTFGYWIKPDDQDYPINGTIINGADTIAAKRIDVNTMEATFKRAGKIIEVARFLVSKDGKIETVTAKGTDAKGQAFSNVTVWYKQ